MGSPRGWRFGLFLSFVTLVLWGSLPIALKAVTVRMDPQTVTWYRYLVATSVLTVVLRNRGLFPTKADFQGRVPVLFTIGVLGFVGNNVLYLWGLTFVSPSAAQVVIQLAPLMLMAGAVWLFHESFGRVQFAGVLILITGMLAFFHQRLKLLVTSSGKEAGGIGLIIISAALWAASTLAQKRLLKQFRSLVIMWVIYSSGFFLLLPIAEPSQIARLDGVEWFFLGYCCVNSLLGYGSFTEAMVHWEASRVSAVVATAPLLTMLFTELAANWMPAYVSHERLALISVLGGCCVVLGSALTAGAKSR